MCERVRKCVSSLSSVCGVNEWRRCACPHTYMLLHMQVIHY
eukprot:COSAG01_NODE_33191_length_568_cov_1.326226_2_plen_40_part_01